MDHKLRFPGAAAARSASAALPARRGVLAQLIRKIRTDAVICALAALFVSVEATPAAAAQILAVQFGATGVTPGQSGFDLRSFAGGVQQSFSALDLNQTDSDLTITAVQGVPANPAHGIAVRAPAANPADGPLANLLSGFFFMEDRAAAGGFAPANGLDFSISGLAANMQVAINIFAYDNRRITDPSLPVGKSFSAGRSSTWTSNLETVDFTTTDELLPSSQYGFVLHAMTDANGSLQFGARSDPTLNDITVLINGFTVSSVPEPGAIGLAAVGLIALSGVRRRRTMRGS